MAERLSEDALFGWACVGAVVLWWDATREDTLSNGVDRALENPRTRYLAIGAVALTSAHLLNILPQRVDPYHYLAKGLRLLDGS